MATNHTKLILDGDSSGLEDAVRKSDKALDQLEGSVDDSNKSLNMYGEKLGKAFGPNQGLHGRLSELETPLRDT
tara:strand:- start:96 stop:317 length:222 start_codon:yes stop_codon:yes gene_type:complete